MTDYNAALYWVSPDWCVTIKYDYTGATRPVTESTMQDSVGPKNKVIEPVKIMRKPLKADR